MSAPVLSWLFNALEKLPKHSKVNQELNLLKFIVAHNQELVETSVKPRTSKPNPQSQSLSRGYGSILPTSLIYIILSTRGCTPWRPEAVMSTTEGANKSRHCLFKGRRKRTGQSTIRLLYQLIHHIAEQFDSMVYQIVKKKR